MAPIRVTSKDGMSAAWGGLREAHGLATTGSGAAPKAEQENGAAPRAGWARSAMRFVRNAAIGMLLLSAVPLVVASTSGDAVWYDYRGTREKLAEVERLRPLMGPRDAAITPMQAGIAFRALETPRVTAESRSTEFPLRVVDAPSERVWERELTPTMFSELMVPAFRRHPAEQFMALSNQIMAQAQGTFSAEELAYLQAVAESPVWRDFDRVASASQVDLIGGRFVLPFREDAFALGMPTVRFADTKQLAYAGVVRAAYYVATGQPERAEAALRSVVSFGFVLIDNGTTLIDALVGRAVADIGRSGLHKWYTLSNDARGLALTAPFPKARSAKGSIGGTEIDVDAVRTRLLANASNPDAARTLRLESLRQLSFSTCGSARGMLFGQTAEVDAAFAEARRTLARYPSEQAFIDLLYEAPARVPVGATSKLSDRLLIGAATVTGMLLDNPRVASCTRILRAYN
jgi:hypothetical protein